MFVFEDIVMLDDRSLQMVLREVDTKDLSLALKATPPEVSAKVDKNMSKRAGDMLREDFVLCLNLVGVFAIDRTRHAPFGRAVFFSPSVILAC